MILFLNGLRGLIILKTLLENKSEIKSVVLNDDNETEIIELVKSQNLNLIIADNINNVDTVSKITPVPGGVGPMTIAMLLENVTKAFYLGVKE